ncbi:DUF4398 domain-containing protein [Chitinimonas sp. BJB300]|uniref:DUF4398 domain-containing protein n=1 Tax=Chitinimonas sp. BJB300 TaxID=1559339 RepID=UPI000C108000|nr:DUF4398 domain-containing protein [Chitinimonas sp. BJB300]PHV10150.1 chromosome partitioning protein ParA [Chitinimonas sp. BJB300]TSJ86127.1 DUF4398 domain-containing protein [Chitinimonas sp. BJB300]
MRIKHENDGVVMGVLLIALAGCVAVPLPREQLVVSQAIINNAQHAGAGHYAAADLALAREKLIKAQAAVQRRKYVEARRWAAEAEADAQLAQTKAAAAKGTQRVREMNEANRTFGKE